jgi:hypothetical protein
MNGYVDVEGLRRAAGTADGAAESMRHSASTAEQAAERMSRAAQQMEDAATRIAHLLEGGYGGNGLRLIELLEAAQKPNMIAQQDIDDFAVDAGHKVEIDREGTCFWHRNCTNHLGGVMKEIKREYDKSLFECMHCAKRAYYPIGAVGLICAKHIDAAIAAKEPK